MERQLLVSLMGSPVGMLQQVEGRLQFVYLPSATVPLSQSLPIRAEPFDDRACRPFFGGLLPEGGKRRQIAKTLQVSAQNDYALLDKLGGECAGAVSLSEVDQASVSSSANDTVQWLSDLQLRQVLDDMPLRPMRAGDKGLRLSLAGAQDKLPVVLGPDGRIGLPMNGLPSTHILKPPIPSVEGSVFNEAFCMALATALRLDVAPSRIHHVQAGGLDDPAHPYLLVTRYDRTVGGDGNIQRLHQEDFCQAMGVFTEHKYQNEGGPGLAQAFALLRRATRPSAPHILKLLDCVVFNALVGNHDAHGKNFSLLYLSQGPVLAPLYDLLCTAVYPALTDKMAMKIGSRYKFTELQSRHWDAFALEAGLTPAPVKKRVLDMARRLPALAQATLQELQAQGLGHPIQAAIVKLLEKRCALTIRRLAD